jgi:5'-3' exonuclease
VNRLAIIDGDVLCYRSFEPRWKAKYGGPTEFDKVTGRTIHQEIEYTKEEDAQYLMESWARFERHVQMMLETLFCDDYIMGFNAHNNFRKELYPDYKIKRGNWRPSEFTRFVPQIAKLAVRGGYGIYADGREVDDFIRIWAREASEAGRDFIICSVDKDLKCIPGKHFNLKTQEIEEVDQSYSTRFFYEQLLMGDQVDNIPGVPSIGPVKAKKYLAECITEEEMQAEVVGCYMAVYGDAWHQYLLANAKLLHIQRDLDDWFTVDGWNVVKELNV